MTRGLIAQAGLLIVGAALAWWAWSFDEDSSSKQGVVLAQLEPADVEEISLTAPKTALTVTPLKEGDDVSWKASLEHEPKPDKKAAKTKSPHGPSQDAGPPPKDAGPRGDGGPTSDAGAAPVELAAKRITSRFPGGRQLVRSLDKLTPLVARRSLGVVPADQLTRMGLDAPERTLVVKAKGKTWTFDIGEGTYGDQARYAKLRGSDEVVLLESAAVRGLEGSVQRLMEARVVSVGLDEMTGLNVESEGRTAVFDHMEREQPKKRRFVVKGQADEKSDEAQGLVATLRGLRAREYVTDEAVAGAKRVARFKIDRHEKPALTVELYEAPDDSYLLRAGPWVGVVPASRGKNLVDDVSAALAVE
jgi:hypothetical protein